MPQRCILTCMALRDLVLYVSRRTARLPNRHSLHEMAMKYDWDVEAVLAFIRCQKHPSTQMLSELARELDTSLEEMQRILGR